MPENEGVASASNTADADGAQNSAATVTGPPATTTTDPLVEQAVRFLVHQQTQATPVSSRITFLQQKGLNATQVAAALTRCGLSAPVEAPVTAPQPASPPAPAQPQRSSRLAWLSAPATATALALLGQRVFAASSRVASTEEDCATLRVQVSELSELSRDMLQRHGQRLDGLSQRVDALTQRMESGSEAEHRTSSAVARTEKAVQQLTIEGVAARQELANLRETLQAHLTVVGLGSKDGIGGGANHLAGVGIDQKGTGRCDVANGAPSGHFARNDSEPWPSQARSQGTAFTDGGPPPGRSLEASARRGERRESSESSGEARQLDGNQRRASEAAEAAREAAEAAREAAERKVVSEKFSPVICATTAAGPASVTSLPLPISRLVPAASPRLGPAAAAPLAPAGLSLSPKVDALPASLPVAAPGRPAASRQDGLTRSYQTTAIERTDSVDSTGAVSESCMWGEMLAGWKGPAAYDLPSTSSHDESARREAAVAADGETLHGPTEGGDAPRPPAGLPPSASTPPKSVLPAADGARTATAPSSACKSASEVHEMVQSGHAHQLPHTAPLDDQPLLSSPEAAAASAGCAMGSSGADSTPRPKPWEREGMASADGASQCPVLASPIQPPPSDGEQSECAQQ